MDNILKQMIANCPFMDYFCNTNQSINKYMNNSSHIQSNSNKSCARKRDYRLVVDGKYNRKAIMQRAWAFMKVYKGYTLKSALRQAWIDAILAMEDYNYSQNIKPRLPKSELTMKSLYANPTGDMANGYATR